MSDFLKEHLNVWWLRPESALWDAIASQVISQVSLERPSLDMGSGNGIFSFITAGGAFTLDYDWFINTDVEGFWDNKDIYDAFHQGASAESIKAPPRYVIDWALDHNPNLIAQCKPLGLYSNYRVADAAKPLPFEEETFQTVFSNILYWLEDPEAPLREIYRILRPGGRALLCLPDPKFFEHCITYQWRERGSELLKKLNRGRLEVTRWTITLGEIEALTARIGFRLELHQRYLSPLTLKIWDIGLRPISAVLIKMANSLGQQARREIKREWIDTCYDLLLPVLEMEREFPREGGYHFVCLRKP